MGQRVGFGSVEKCLNTMSGEEVLWREWVVRPIQMSVALPPENGISNSSRQPLAPGSRTAMRATSLLNSVTYIERSATKALPPVTGLSSTASRTMRFSSTESSFSVPAEPSLKSSLKDSVAGSKAISLMFTTGRPASCSIGPNRNEET
jgi:hypothetical protein